MARKVSFRLSISISLSELVNILSAIGNVYVKSNLSMKGPSSDEISMISFVLLNMVP